MKRQSYLFPILLVLGTYAFNESTAFAQNKKKVTQRSEENANWFGKQAIQWLRNPGFIVFHRAAFSYASKKLGFNFRESLKFAQEVQSRPDRDTFVGVHKRAYKKAQSSLGMNQVDAKRYADRATELPGSPDFIPFDEEAFTHAYKILKLDFEQSLAFANQAQSRPDRDTYIGIHRQAFDHVYHGLNADIAVARRYADRITGPEKGFINALYQEVLQYFSVELGMPVTVGVHFANRIVIEADPVDYFSRYRAAMSQLIERLNQSPEQLHPHANRIARDTHIHIEDYLVQIEMNQDLVQERGGVKIREQVTWDDQEPTDISSVFGKYRGSEAEILSFQLKKRHFEKTYVESVEIEGSSVSITAADIPNAQLKGYLIHSPKIAQLLDVVPNTVLSQDWVDSLDPKKKSLVSVAVMEPALIEVVNHRFNPEYRERPISEDQRKYLNRVRKIINERITILNLSDASGYFWRAEGRDRGTLSIHAKEEHWERFAKLMNSIVKSHEQEFMNALIELATLFDRDHSEAKNGFIEVFTYLFVTKQFPSVGARQAYFHFLLNCGGVY